MVARITLIALVGGFSLNVAAPQGRVTLRSAVVVLGADQYAVVEF